LFYKGFFYKYEIPGSLGQPVLFPGCQAPLHE